MTVVVGAVSINEEGRGNPLRNSAVVLRNGEVTDIHHKTLLPAYDVFDERRYFEPATDNHPVRLGDRQVGLTICSDAWASYEAEVGSDYGVDPVGDLCRQGAELIINISASPFSVGKQRMRRQMLGTSARRHGVPLLYVNLVGGNDQIIFDGRSLAIDAEGRVVAQGAAFEEDLLVVQIDQLGGREPPPDIDPVEELWGALVLGLRDYARKCGFGGSVLGLSGGVDSALTAAIAAEALGPRNVTALFMPTRFSSERSRRDAEAVAANLGVGLHCIPIEDLRTGMEEALAPFFEGTQRGAAEENIQARMRGTIVMAFANKYGLLPLATGNKSELAVGYCTLYGDMVGGLAVIGDVPKTMVYRLSRHANRRREVIPQAVLDRPPSAELKPDQTDQDVLPPYEVLDPILNLYIEQNLELDRIVQEGFEPETVRAVLGMVDRAEFKRRQAPITLRVTHKAFGLGRRLPVAQNWHRSGR